MLAGVRAAASAGGRRTSPASAAARLAAALARGAPASGAPPELPAGLAPPRAARSALGALAPARGLFSLALPSTAGLAPARAARPALGGLALARGLVTLALPATAGLARLPPRAPCGVARAPALLVPGAAPAALGVRLLGGAPSEKKRNKLKMKKHRYIRNVKAVRYVSCIPQYLGPLGRQTKKRPIIKMYRATPRLRIFGRQR
ncbi:unnamed protein product [Prorocentrum cordatum]|uniref:50S ribosomal protein L35 n=1 Tax=Prorocentrum cordatum TaxID=2364126 RepID=A0ABN9RKE6_9DINO|nr:unnamed protein product [Polarella glacialis]